MLLFVAIAHPQIVSYLHLGPLGRMVIPKHSPRITDTAAAGIPWAADNGAFSGLDVNLYRHLVEKIAGLPGCKFLTVPDVVADHERTLDLWHGWRDYVRYAGQPLAFVLQNGATVDTVPWDELDAVFVGGDTAWKLSPLAGELCWEAHRRGKWVHMGRVNSMKRLERARSTYCDSVDGNSYSMFRDRHLPPALKYLGTPTQYAVPGT